MLFKIQGQTCLTQEAIGVENRDASSYSSSSRECLRCDCSGTSITASTIPVHCSASSSLFARHSARSRGSHNPRYSAIFLLEFTIYRIYQLLLFVACFRIGSSLRSIFALPTLVPHSTLHFSAYCERVLRTSSRLPFVGECSQYKKSYKFLKNT